MNVLIAILLLSFLAPAPPPSTMSRSPEGAKILAQLKRNLRLHRGYDAPLRHTGNEIIRESAENEVLCEALVKHGVIRAAPWIKQAHAYAMSLPERTRDPSAVRAYASCVYALSMEILEAWDGQAIKPYEPAPIQEEQARMLLRPERGGTGGLVAVLELTTPLANAPNLVLASKPLGLTLRLTNHSKKGVVIEPEELVFSMVTGPRTEVPARRLPAPTRSLPTDRLAAGKSVDYTWTIPRVADSPLAASFGTGGVYIKARLPSKGVVSNTLSFYFNAFE